MGYVDDREKKKKRRKGKKGLGRRREKFGGIKEQKKKCQKFTGAAIDRGLFS